MTASINLKGIDLYQLLVRSDLQELTPFGLSACTKGNVFVIVNIYVHLEMNIFLHNMNIYRYFCRIFTNPCIPDCSDGLLHK